MRRMREGIRRNTPRYCALRGLLPPPQPFPALQGRASLIPSPACGGRFLPRLLNGQALSLLSETCTLTLSLGLFFGFQTGLRRLNKLTGCWGEGAAVLFLCLFRSC